MSAQTEVNLLPAEFPDEPEEVTVYFIRSCS